MTDSVVTPAPHRSEKNASFRVAAAIVKPIANLIARKSWSGLEHIPKQGGFLAAGNHASNFDALTFAHFLYNSGRPPRIMAKASLWKIPVLGALLRGTQMIPVERGSAHAKDSIVIAQERLHAGYCVAIFPEGTHTREPDGWPMQGRTGVARLALESQAPVIPIAQWGAREVWPRGTKLPKIFPRRTVLVRAGAPVDLSDLYGRPLDSAVLREATDRIMWAIIAMVAEMRGEQAPTELFVPGRK